MRKTKKAKTRKPMIRITGKLVQKHCCPIHKTPEECRDEDDRLVRNALINGFEVVYVLD
jgi:hypothetical protein